MSSAVSTQILERVKSFQTQAQYAESLLGNQVQQATKALEKLPLPTRKDENYLNTDFSQLESVAPYYLNPPTRIIQQSDIEAAAIESDNLIVFSNGLYNPYFSKLEVGIELIPINISQVPQGDSSLIEWFGEFDPNDYFDCLNLAGLTHGLILKVKGDIKNPLNIIHFITPENSRSINNPRIAIKVEKNRRVHVWENTHFISDQPIPYFHNPLIKFYLDSQADVHYTSLGQEGAHGILHASSQAKLERDAHFKAVLFNVGGKLQRRSAQAELIQSGSNAQIHGGHLQFESGHIDFHSHIHHRVSHTSSAQMAHGILDGQASSCFTGNIHVHPHAENIESAQLNKSILLSPKARVFTRPQLEVANEEVKASHGATIGQIDPDQVFYLQTRGLNLNKANRLLSLAHLTSVTDLIDNSSVKNKLVSILSLQLDEILNKGDI